MSEKICIAPGCCRLVTRPNKTNKCDTHKYKWQRYKSFDTPEKIKIEKPCRIEGCKFKRVKHRTLCSPHIQRYKHFKDYNLNPKFFMPDDFLMHCNTHGYIKSENVIFEKNGNKKCKPCDQKRRTEIRYKIDNASDTEKYCTGCKEVKALDQFREFDKKTRLSYCVDCRRTREDISYYRDGKSLIRKYGINREDYNKILEKQNDVCAICKMPEDSKTTAIDKSRKRFLCVDHDHSKEHLGSKMVRGLLCLKCNHGLGCFKDSPEILRTAAEYLEAYNKK